jgi:hypothetical protein
MTVAMHTEYLDVLRNLSQRVPITRFWGTVRRPIPRWHLPVPELYELFDCVAHPALDRAVYFKRRVCSTLLATQRRQRLKHAPSWRAE